MDWIVTIRVVTVLTTNNVIILMVLVSTDVIVDIKELIANKVGYILHKSRKKKLRKFVFKNLELKFENYTFKKCI